MIAVVLAAGKGTRLSEFYSCSSKCMVPFEGKPLIDKTLNNLSKFDRLKKIYIVIRPDEREIPSYIGMQYDQIPIDYCIQDMNKTGIINAIYSVGDIVNFEDEDVVINLGDEYYDNINYRDLIARHKEKKSAVTPVVVYCEDKEEIKKNYSVDISEGGRILNAVEKPVEVFNNYVGTGIIVIKGEILKGFASNCKSCFKDKQLVDFIKYSISIEKECYICEVKTAFCNLNYQKDLEYLYTVSYKNITESIEETFNKVVKQNLDKVAIRSTNSFITYSSLDEKSNVFREKLRKFNFKEGDCAAIIYSDAIEVIIEIMGILKAGGCYIIFDDEYIKSAPNYITQATEINIIIENNNIKAIERNSEVLTTRNLDKKALLLSKSNDGQVHIISQSSILNLSRSINKQVVSRCQKDTVEVGMISKLNNNYSIPFIYTSILNGCTLNILDKNEEDKVEKYISKINKFDICEVTGEVIGSVNKNLLDRLESKVLVFNEGELSKEMIDELLELGVNSDIIKFYGKDESTIINMLCLINKKNVASLDKSIIGKPILNTRVYILDSNKKMLGVNTIGDIWVAGDGIELRSSCNENFQKDLINNKLYMFKTGDRGYFGLDGNVYLQQ